ncbi:MAG: chloride channel protein [Gemmataceae bacterium]|nr:chloride channel protein [Gemmataceae bacterium]
MKMLEKGDFTAQVRLVWIAALAVFIGVVCAFVAVVLLWLIAVFTNLFFFQTLSAVPRAPAANTMGLGMIVVPVLGGLIIGLLARYGSERIRGHGIPEAIEAILIGRSRMQPRVAVLKPLSSAVSIGSGGPFGAEGPIIMTGGAFGSIVAQIFRLTAAERKTLLVAGAAGGMAATFATPVAAVLLAVELLLFEWKPRSLVPVALASAAAVVVRPYLLEPGPLFPVVPHAGLEATAYFSAAALGLLTGALALLLTLAVYRMEDLFHRLPVHWMWWPAIGGLAVGIGGYFQPRALGIGYDLIEGLLRGNIAQTLDVAPQQAGVALLALIFVKGTIWAVALGSGTSGGVLAPLLIMGGALGALVGPHLPGGDVPLWALVSVAAILGGTMRSPLTGVVFALELTRDVATLPVLLVASTIAYLFTVLLMKRSILTEKVARRGYHVSREYSVDPLERLTVEDVMACAVVVIPAGLPVRDVLVQYFLAARAQRHQGYPVVDTTGKLVGMVTRSNLLEDWIYGALRGAEGGPAIGPIIAYDLVHREPITVFPWESCRTAAERMAQAGVGRLPVVAADDPGKVIGIITRSDLLKPRAQLVEEEVKRERFIGAGFPFPAPGEAEQDGQDAPP